MLWNALNITLGFLFHQEISTRASNYYTPLRQGGINYMRYDESVALLYAYLCTRQAFTGERLLAHA